MESISTAGFEASYNSAGVVNNEIPLTVGGQLVRLPHAPAGDVPTTEFTLRDRSAIIVDEWGPYDWQSPKLWPVDSSRAVPLRLAVLGPAGTWRVVARRGVAAISRAAGSVGDTIAITPDPDSVGDWEGTLE